MSSAPPPIPLSPAYKKHGVWTEKMEEILVDSIYDVQQHVEGGRVSASYLITHSPFPAFERFMKEMKNQNQTIPFDHPKSKFRNRENSPSSRALQLMAYSRFPSFTKRPE